MSENDWIYVIHYNEFSAYIIPTREICVFYLVACNFSPLWTCVCHHTFRFLSSFKPLFFPIHLLFFSILDLLTLNISYLITQTAWENIWFDIWCRGLNHLVLKESRPLQIITLPVQNPLNDEQKILTSGIWPQWWLGWEVV